jgi:uncharacterized protein HemX
MSDTTPPDAAAHADTGEALARLAAYGKRDKNSGWGRFVLALVLLVPLAAVAWVAWMQVGLTSELAALRADNATLQQLSATSTSQFAQVQQRQQELDTEVQQTLQQELAASTAASATQAERLAALESEVATTRLRVNALDAGGSPLAEAQMLLRFAQQRLDLARDVPSAIELFLAADTLLREINDPALATVRRTLAGEVAQLQAVPVIDVSGLFVQLSEQAARIESFIVASTAAAQDFSVAPAAAETAVANSWWAGVKQTLGEYFVVTRGTGQVLPQLDASEQFQLRALVQLHIEQAKLALLRAEPELYQAALNDALGTSRRWLRSEDGSFDDFVAVIEALRDMPIVADIPAVGQTLVALQQLSGTTAPATISEPDESPAASPGTPQ